MSSDSKVCSEHPQAKRLRPSELPVYEAGGQSTSSSSSEQEPGGLETAVNSVRKEMWVYLDKSKCYKKKVVDVVADQEKQFGALMEYLREEKNVLPRVSAIGVGGLTGAILGIRGGLFRKLIYSSATALGVASLCYPKRASEVSEEVYQTGKRYAVIGYNFVAGVKPDWKQFSSIVPEKLRQPEVSAQITQAIEEVKKHAPKPTVVISQAISPFPPPEASSIIISQVSSSITDSKVSSSVPDGQFLILAEVLKRDGISNEVGELISSLDMYIFPSERGQNRGFFKLTDIWYVDLDNVDPVSWDEKPSSHERTLCITSSSVTSSNSLHPPVVTITESRNETAAINKIQGMLDLSEGASSEEDLPDKHNPVEEGSSGVNLLDNLPERPVLPSPPPTAAPSFPTTPEISEVDPASPDPVLSVKPNSPNSLSVPPVKLYLPNPQSEPPVKPTSPHPQSEPPVKPNSPHPQFEPPVKPTSPHPQSEPPVNPNSPHPQFEPPVKPNSPHPQSEPPVNPNSPHPQFEPPVKPTSPHPQSEPPVKPNSPHPQFEPPVKPTSPHPQSEPPVNPNSPHPQFEPPVKPSSSNPQSEPPVKPSSPNPQSEPPVKPSSPNPQSEPPVKPTSPNPQSEPPVKPSSPNPQSEPPVKPSSPNPQSEPPVKPSSPNPQSSPPLKPTSPHPQSEPPLKPVSPNSRPVTPVKPNSNSVSSIDVAPVMVDAIKEDAHPKQRVVIDQEKKPTKLGDSGQSNPADKDLYTTRS